MKAYYYFFGIALLALGSCSSGLYVGTEYDDLYYQNSDKPVTRAQVAANQQPAEGDLRAGNYYNNVYAPDTLVSQEYSNAVDSTVNNDRFAGNGGYFNDYYYDYPYAGRLRNFYGSSFYPYWRDPMYYSWYPSFGFNYYGGYPYYSYYDPFYYDMFYSPFYYGYSGFYGSMFYGGLFNNYGWPYYNNYYYGYYTNDEGGIQYGRRERPSTLSSRFPGGSYSSVATGSRRSVSTVSGVPGTTGSQVTYNSSRRSVSSVPSQDINTSSSRRGIQDQVRTGNGTVSSQSRNVARPEYNSVNRSYTPSYSNPRMSTRPSYNNTRVNPNVNQNIGSGSYNRVNSNTGTGRTGQIQRYNQGSSTRNSYSNSGSLRTGPSSYRSSQSYSVPSRRSSESGFSSGSYRSSSSSSYRSSSSSGSSFSRGGGSFSSGSSSRSSSGSSSSSGGRRR